ncbi:MAG: hypothetical protein ACRERC_14780 [Candidatus Binatia bacterium]
MTRSAYALAATLSLCVASSATASVSVSIPDSREAILGAPHKKNNDGSWGYGWVRITARTLIGFDIDPLEGRTVENAFIKFYVAQNHFTAAGRVFVAQCRPLPNW